VGGVSEGGGLTEQKLRGRRGSMPGTRRRLSIPYSECAERLVGGRAAPQQHDGEAQMRPYRKFRPKGRLDFQWLASGIVLALLTLNFPPTEAQTGLVSVTVITTQSCTADINDSWSPSPRVLVRIGPHAVITDGAGHSAPLLLPPGSHTVFAASEQDPNARLGYVNQGGHGLRIEAKLDGGAPVVLSGPREGLEVRMLTCDPGGQPVVRATVVEIGGRMSIKRKHTQLNGYLGAPLRDGDIVTIRGTGKLTWLEGGTISFDDPRPTKIEIGPLRPESTVAPKGLSSIGVLRGIVTFFLPHDRGNTKRRQFEATSGTVAVAIRGTIFTFGHDDEKQVSTIFVREGSVDVTPVNPSLTPFVLSAGQQVQVALNDVSPITAAADTAGQTVGGAATRSCFGNDRGAAGVDRDAHYYWAQQNMEKVAGNLNYKIDLLWRCPAMNDEQLSSAFADLSVVTTRYVTAGCGSRARDVTFTGGDWQPHKDWARQRNRQEILDNLQRKAAAALQCLDSTGRINFFADTSVALARGAMGLAGGGATTSSPTPGPAPQPAPPTPSPGLQPARTSSQGCVGFAGLWKSESFGSLSLKQDGSTVNGTYTFDTASRNGTLRGTVTNNELSADWWQVDGRNGQYKVQLSADGNSFSGEIGMAGWGGRDTATCLAAQTSAPQSALQQAQPTPQTQSQFGQVIDAGKEKLRDQPAPGTIRIKVSAVFDRPGDTPVPVKDARVRVTVWAGGTGTYTAKTNEGGVAFLDVPRKPDHKYTIEVSDPGILGFRFTGDKFVSQKQDFQLAENETYREVAFKVAPGGEETVELRLHVTREGTTDPVPGARVRIWADRSTNAYDEISTDANGHAIWRVLRDLQKGTGNVYPVEVSKEGFETERIEVFVARGHKSPTFDRSVELKRASGIEAKITVKSKDDGSPVEGASVVFAQEASGVSVPGNTDPSGQATLFLTRSGKYQVRVTHSKFEAESRMAPEVRIGRDQVVELSFALERKPEEPIALSLTVSVGEANPAPSGGHRQWMPISGAQVSTPNGPIVNTDSEGRAELFIREGALGGATVEVTAQAQGYRSMRKVVPIEGRRIGAKALREHVAFHLEPGEDSPTAETPLQLTIHVADSANPDLPIVGAEVSLKLRNGRVLEATSTDTRGNAEFIISGSPDVPMHLVRAGLMADVIPPTPLHRTKLNNWVATDFLSSSDPRTFMVGLEDRFAEMLAEVTAQVVTLEKLVAEIENKAHRQAVLTELVQASEKDLKRDLGTVSTTTLDTYAWACRHAKAQAEKVRQVVTQDLNSLVRDAQARSNLGTEVAAIRKRLKDWDNNPDFASRRLEQNLNNARVILRAAQEASREMAENHQDISQLAHVVGGENPHQKGVKIEDLLSFHLYLSEEQEAQVESLRSRRDAAVDRAKAFRIASEQREQHVAGLVTDIQSLLDVIEQSHFPKIKSTCEDAKRTLDTTAAELTNGLATAIADLEAKLAAWNNDAGHAALIKALESQAAGAIKTAQAVKGLLDEVEYAGRAFAGVVPTYTVCRQAAELRNNIEGYKRQADHTEQQLKNQLDEAATAAANCSSPADADRIRNKYNSAIKLAAQIGVLEKKATHANGDLGVLVERTKEQRRILHEVERKVAEMTSMWPSPSMWANPARASAIAEADFQRARDSIKHHEARRSGLMNELRGVQARYEVVAIFEQSRADPALLSSEKKRLDDLHQRLDVIVTDNQPKTEWLQNVKASAAEIQTYQQRAEAALQRYKGAICDPPETLDSTVSAMGSLTTSATIEIVAAAHLRDKADACVARALTPTTMIPPSLGPRVVGAPLPPKVPTTEIPAIVGLPAAGTSTQPAKQAPPTLSGFRLELIEPITPSREPDPNPNANPKWQWSPPSPDGGSITMTSKGPTYSVTYQWTGPGQQIGPDGADVTISIEINPPQPNGDLAAGIYVEGENIGLVGTPQNYAEVYKVSQNGRSADGSLTVKVKPPANAGGEAAIWIGAKFGPGFKYRYRVVR
jgi:hypothetical protein